MTLVERLRDLDQWLAWLQGNMLGPDVRGRALDARFTLREAIGALQTEPSDAEVMDAMAVYGGSFAQALAAAARKADPDNLLRIKATWPEYWQEYTEAAKLRKSVDGRTTIEEQS